MRRKSFLNISISILFILVIMSGTYMFKLKERYRVQSENSYNEAFVSLVNYINNIENFLAKLQISKSSSIAASNLMQVWKEASLASINISKLPNSDNDLAKISKFLNQVSDYSYSLARKTIEGEDLTSYDLEKIKDIHVMSKDVEESLNQLTEELNKGTLKWIDFEKNSTEYAQNVDSFNIFNNLDTNLKEYEGLIYDGAYSDHVEKDEKKGLTGNDISEEDAKSKVRGFFKDKNIEKITSNGLVKEVNIPYYNFDVKFFDDYRVINISISQKGGHVIEFNSNLNVKNSKIDVDNAKAKGKEFLDSHGFESMKETYYINQNNILTINYAYLDDGVICYPDLIKVKVSLEDGSILGLEAYGYLNSHHDRILPEKKITIEEAKSKLNDKIEILSQGEAVIPTEWKTEIYVYEFKGKIDDLDFLVYVNVETGKEEDILMILETEGGVLTM